MPALNPYLSFRTEAREAMEFYQSVLGGELGYQRVRGIPRHGAGLRARRTWSCTRS